MNSQQEFVAGRCLEYPWIDMFENSTVNEDGVLDVDAREVFEKISQIKLVDVRREEEFHGELGHISGAELSTLETQYADYVKTLDPNQHYVFICRSGRRSSRAAVIAKNHGIENVYNLAGGMIRWNEIDLPIVEAS